MPRSKFGKKRSPVNSENLTIAAKKCIGGEISMCEAAIRYKISKTTLTRHISSFRRSGAAEFKYTASNNTKQVFSQEEEESLKNYLLTAAYLHYGLTKAEARRLAYQFAFANTQKYPDSWITEKIAGKEWLRHFLKRHPELELKMKKPETTFLSNFTEVLNSDNFPPEKIWNCDETTVGERNSQNITIIAAVSACGDCIPPMLIFPKVTFRLTMLKGCPAGTIGGANPSGLSNAGLFLRFLAHFTKHIKPTADDPFILILDNHEGHVSIEAIRICQENGIILVTFDPRTTHKKQPLDCAFGSMKSYYDTAYREWMDTNPNQLVSIKNMAELIGIAFPKAFIPSNIQKGFHITGVFPVDENILDHPGVSGMDTEDIHEVDDVTIGLIPS